MLQWSNMEDLEQNDHRRIGKELGLFTFSETVGKGLPLWTAKGTAIRRELERFIVDEEIKRGYQHVTTPDIAKLELYKKSGHYPYYKDSMYSPIAIDAEEFMLRPMTCPHHFELYLAEPHSYRELPIRIAELAKLYRYENSGNLIGLVRTRSFCLADAHIICTDENQAKSEILKALDLISYIQGIFGLEKGKDYWYRLSLGDLTDSKKYYKDDEAWITAEQALREVLEIQDVPFTEAKDEAAFYGPKIDVQMKDKRGQENTAFTVQYDFVMPKRFNLVYINQEGKEQEAVVIHRSSIGAIERIMAFLIEHYGGAFPLWLAPVQVGLLPVATAHEEYAKKVEDELKQAGIRTEFYNAEETLSKRIREVKTKKLPYYLVIGDKEQNSSDLTVESRNGEKSECSIKDLLSKLETEIKNRL